MNQLEMLLSVLSLKGWKTLKMKDVPEDREYRGSIKLNYGMRFEIFMSEDSVSHEPLVFAWMYSEEKGYHTGSWQMLVEI